MDDSRPASCFPAVMVTLDEQHTVVTRREGSEEARDRTKRGSREPMIFTASRSFNQWQSSDPWPKRGVEIFVKSGTRATACVLARRKRTRARLLSFLAILAYSGLLIYAVSDGSSQSTPEVNERSECRITKDLCPTGYQPSDDSLAAQ